MTSESPSVHAPRSDSPRFADLFRDGNAGAVGILAGGFLLAAITMFVTTALMPSVVAEIGGRELYAWPTTIYVVVSIIGVMGVGQALARLGAVGAYLLAFATYLVGGIVCTLAPTMPVLLAGRAVVGLGGGLLSGLGYALVRTVLPQHLWGMATGLISAMFGVGTLVGPVLGGLFAQLDAWRLAFAMIALAGLALGIVAPRALRGHGRTGQVEPFPLGSVALLTAAVAALSVASITEGAARVALLAAAAVLLVAFVAWDRRARSSVLPDSTYRPGSPMRWLMLTNAMLTIAVVSEAFTPLFGQSMAGLAPVVAGFFGAAVSVGWSFFGLLGARAATPRSRSALLIIGPGLLAAGFLGAALTQREPAGPGLAIVWFVLLVIAGAGIGFGFPVLSYATMSNVTDAAEAGKAAATIPLVGLAAQSLGAALAGVLVNAGLPSMPQAAINLFVGLAVLAALGVVTALAAVRRGAVAE